MLQKINTYFWYFYEYLKHRDFVSILAAVKYLIYKKSHTKDRIIQSTVGKFFCRKNTNDFQFANFRYEWGVKKYVLDHIHEYTLFVDAGACVGEYAILVTNKGIRTIAFEPIPTNFEILTKNLSLNNMKDKVMAFPVGLGNRNQKVKFVFNKINTGASHLDSENKSDGCEVDIRTFDSYLDELKLNPTERILFKLDVEGMEAIALQGAKEFIRKYPNITFILEEKITGEDKIVSVLDELSKFQYGRIDRFNIYANKI
jgi:FkbM family methyltransferase